MNDGLGRASLGHRAGWLGVAALSVAVLGVALALEPDPRGFGTHQQLGLPPCGFQWLTGFLCPGCGLTTSFAYGVRGNWVQAALANPIGLALFIGVCLSIPVGVLSAVRGWSFGDVIDRFALDRWALVFAVAAVLVWIARVSAAL